MPLKSPVAVEILTCSTWNKPILLSNDTAMSLPRIIASLRLEKTFKIMESNCKPNTAKSTTKPCLSAACKCLLNTSKDGDSTTSLGSLFQCLTTLSVKKFLLIPNLNYSAATWGHFHLSHHLLLGKKETLTHLTTTSFQVVVESEKISPQTPLL